MSEYFANGFFISFKNKEGRFVGTLNEFQLNEVNIYLSIAERREICWKYPCVEENVKALSSVEIKEK